MRAEYPAAWQNVLDLQARLADADSGISETPTNFENKDETDDEEDAEDDEDDKEDGEDGEATEDEAKSMTSAPEVTSSTGPTSAFDAFLELISTICPSLPHLTYPLLLVVISTIPDTLLPLQSPPSLPLQNLFSNLWSAVDARLLSTHSLPGHRGCHDFPDRSR
jgi:hypothetical protein